MHSCFLQCFQTLGLISRRLLKSFRNASSWENCWGARSPSASKNEDPPNYRYKIQVWDDYCLTALESCRGLALLTPASIVLVGVCIYQNSSWCEMTNSHNTRISLDINAQFQILQYCSNCSCKQDSSSFAGGTLNAKSYSDALHWLDFNSVAHLVSISYPLCVLPENAADLVYNRTVAEVSWKSYCPETANSRRSWSVI